MIETNIPNLGTKEIMRKIKQKIKREVNKYQEPVLQAVPLAYYKVTDFTQYDDIAFITNIYRGILQREPDEKGMQLYLNKLRTGELSKIEILSLIRLSEEGKFKNIRILGIKNIIESNTIITEKPFEHKDHYTVTDFTQYDDAEFITNLYRGLLKRESDIPGMQQHLHQLHTGERSKIEILIAMRFSAEGKSENVKILGINSRFLIATLYRLPIIGYFAKTVITLLTLPKLLKRLNRLESSLALVSLKNKSDTDAIFDAMQLCIMNRAELEILSKTKAEKTELGIQSNDAQNNLPYAANKEQDYADTGYKL